MSLLKQKRISDDITHYVDAETNEPVFIEKRLKEKQRYSNARYSTEIHPHFKEIHGLDTPFTHLKHDHIDKIHRDTLDSHYKSVLDETPSIEMKPKVKVIDKGVMTKKSEPTYKNDLRTGEKIEVTPARDHHYRELHVKDSTGEHMGKIILYAKESYNPQTREYDSRVENEIYPSSRSYMSVDEKFMKKNKFHPELIGQLKNTDSELKGNIESFEKIASYKEKKPAFFGAENSMDGDIKRFKTTLKPKEALERYIKHLHSTHLSDNVTFKVSGNTAIGKDHYGDSHDLHHIEYTPSTEKGEAPYITHAKTRISGKNRLGRNSSTIIESKSFSQLRKELNEVAEMPEIKKTADVGNNIKHGFFLLNFGEDMNQNEHESMQIGPKTKSGHIITYHYPVQKEGEWESKRYLTAHHVDDPKHPHVTLSMDVETRGIPSFKVGGLSKDKIRSTIPAHEVYAHFIKHGPEGTIMSTDSQSLGGEMTWSKLARYPSINVHGYDPESDQVVNTHPLLHPDFRHETHANSLDMSTRPGRENNEAYRLWLVAHKK